MFARDVARLRAPDFALARHYLTFKSESFHSSYGRAAYFLCSCRESKQRDTPQSIAPCARPARRVRVSGRVPLTARPCAGNGMSAIHRAHPCGASSSAAAAMQWGPGKPKQRAPARRSTSAPFRLLHLPPRCAQGKENLRFPCAAGEAVAKRLKGALLILLVIFGSPFAVARAGRKCSQRRAHDAREFVARTRLHAQGCAFNEPRHAVANCRRQRGIRGAFSLVPFLLCEQEKGTRALDARGKPNGRE